MSGYCPLGQGQVDIPVVLNLMEGRKLHGMVMVELDYDNRESLVPLDLLKTSKAYLLTQGITFRS